MKRILQTLVFIIFFTHLPLSAQIDEDQLGAWYMYFFDATLSDGPWGVQGDIQYRNWDLIGDLQQMMLRGGLTYSPGSSKAKFTLGYANITTGTFGSDDSTFGESRIYQEALIPWQLANRVFTNHRLRSEQRFVEGQDFRTRYRYNLFVNIPLNSATIEPNTLYLAIYNEIFINGERDIGSNREVEAFDRNRFYAALGYAITTNSKLQIGVMNQSSKAVSKNQLQLSYHHKI